MELPEGRIKGRRMRKRASGWYLCLFINAEAKKIERVRNGVIGIDPGFQNLLTTSEGEVVEHPREFEQAQRRLAQAQRGHHTKLAARLQERIGNRRKDRNHKLSRRLVAENVEIHFSKDNNRGMAKKFGKSVASSGHVQLRSMLAYKSPASGTQGVTHREPVPYPQSAQRHLHIATGENDFVFICYDFQPPLANFALRPYDFFCSRTSQFHSPSG